MVWCWFAFFIFFQILSLLSTVCRKKELILKGIHTKSKLLDNGEISKVFCRLNSFILFKDGILCRIFVTSRHNIHDVTSQYSWRHNISGWMAKHLLYCHIQIKVSSLYKLVTSYPSENIKGISCNRDLESMDKTLTYEYPISSKNSLSVFRNCIGTLWAEIKG